ncbi:trypco2 family protein [Streptomyces sp. NPDC097610]|uniref:trypco2 family protein n=1 Tax=Streptomyces sp. NPDC097610 TaxID=3157227 RepID=UPI003325C24B
MSYGELLTSQEALGADVPQEPWAELGETVSAIRAQLQQAMDEGAGQALKFRTGPVELEFSIEVRKEGEAKAKVFVLPWSGETRGTVSADMIHRIKLTLQPIDDADADARIYDQASQRPS